jgi:hypothetical protein
VLSFQVLALHIFSRWLTHFLHASCLPQPFLLSILFSHTVRSMPPGTRRSRSRSRAVTAEPGFDIRAALARGAVAHPSAATLSPEQEDAICEWPLDALEGTKAAWKEPAAASTALLLMANLRLLPDRFRAAFALPSPDDPVADVPSLTARIQSLLQVAVQFHRAQRLAWEPFAAAECS